MNFLAAGISICSLCGWAQRPFLMPGYYCLGSLRGLCCGHILSSGAQAVFVSSVRLDPQAKDFATFILCPARHSPCSSFCKDENKVEEICSPCWLSAGHFSWHVRPGFISSTLCMTWDLQTQSRWQWHVVLRPCKFPLLLPRLPIFVFGVLSLCGAGAAFPTQGWPWAALLTSSPMLLTWRDEPARPLPWLGLLSIPMFLWDFFFSACPCSFALTHATSPIY